MPDSFDKTIAPTPHRRQQAREQGHVAQSNDLVAAGLLVAGLTTIFAIGGRVVEFLIHLVREQLGGEAWLTVDADSAVHRWYAVLMELTQVFAPILGILLVAAIGMHLVQIGFLWNPERALPDGRRISPLAGLQRIFSLTGGARLSFGLVKLVVVSLVAFWSLYHRFGEIMEIGGQDVAQIAAYLVDITLWTAIKIGLALVVLGIADYGYQRWRHERDLRMTPQELREEMRNLQGDPRLQSRRRNAAREIASARLASAVRDADLVLTAANALAVALRYDPAAMPAPLVIAKGVGGAAESIRRAALQHSIAIVDRKHVAQSLYRQVGLNMAIPETLFEPVAQLLAEVYQRQGKPLPGRAAA